VRDGQRWFTGRLNPGRRSVVWPRTVSIPTLRNCISGSRSSTNRLSVRRGAAQKGGAASGLAGLASGRAGTGKVVASTGVRGLSEEELKSAKFDEAETKKMETASVSKDDARKFAGQAQLKSIQLGYLPQPLGAPK